MSKVKNPREKKRLSLTRDRRNTYGECRTSSRKNIARAKKRQHKDERHQVTQLLHRLSGQIDEDQASETEVEVKVAIVASRGKGFKKVADKPLGMVIQRNKAHRLKKSS